MLSWLRREMLNSSHSCLKPSCSTLVFERKTAVSALQEREDFQPSNASKPHISSVHDLGHLDRRQIGSLLQGGLSLSQGKNLHTCIIQAGRETDIFLMNHLVNMYGKCGAFEEAVSVFDDIQSPNLVSWNVLMSTYAQHGFRKDTFQLFTQLQKEGFKPNKITFLSLLRVCDSQTALPDGRHIHLCVISNGLENDPIVGGALVTMYGKCEALQEAQVVFERSNVGDVVSWNSMISAVAQQGDRRKALKFFWLMLERRVEPDRITFTSVLHACDDVEVLEEGMAIHVCIIESGLDSDAIVGTALVNMYGKCGVLDAARAVFDDIKTQDVVSWTALITAYAQQEHSMDTLDCFQKMQLEGVKPNEFTFVSALNACASLTVLEEGKTIHAYVVESGFEHNCVVGTALVKMYSNCGALEFARMVFDDMRKRNVVTWTTMIDAYNEKGHAREALDLFWQMQQGQVKPDEFSCVSALTACTSLTALMEGLRVHDCIVDGGFEMNYFVQTALVKMYGDCGAIDKAQTVFDQLYPRDLVSWNAMLAVYAQQGHHKDSLQLFQQMLSEGMQPNATSFLSVLSACAGLAALSEGTLIHAHIVDCGFESDVLVANALINMYGRCGTLTDACLVFDRMHQRTVMTWTSMVAAYAQQGQAKKAVQVFQSMQHEGVKPDGIAFITVLSACSHAGFIDDGLHFFASMSKEHGIIPTLDHYKCLIDLFGRSGRLKEAEDLITKMPLQPDAISWISLLSACKKHGDVTRGRWVAEQAIDLDSKYSAPYVLISNIYSIDENLEDEENLEIFVGKVS